MKVFKITPATSQNSPFYFGGDIANVSSWPKNPDGEYLLLLFTVSCKFVREKLERSDFPESGVLHVFSTYKKDEYFLDSLTADEVQEDKNALAYTRVLFSESSEGLKCPALSMPLQYAELVEEFIDDSEYSVASLASVSAPNGVIIPERFRGNYNFFCQVYSSDFPDPFQDALYMTDALGCLLINKGADESKVDGCFYVQVS